MTVRIIQGDCREVLRTLADDSVHSIVTDPPYELGFMGKAWDRSGVMTDPAVWNEAKRVLRPGGFLLAFGGTRTYHRLACAIEDAGFEIRDMVSWLYGSGFPKGTDKAKIPPEWKGWNTALKPACEPICMARKPMQGTLAENLTKWGTGALWVDGCRIQTGDALGGGTRPGGAHDGWTRPFHDDPAAMQQWEQRKRENQATSEALGRWPANVIHDGSDEVVALFPSEAGAAAPVHKRNGDKFRTTFGEFKGNIDEAGSTFQGDRGSAARFFYCAKASREDRNIGCDDLKAKPLIWSSGEQSPGTFQSPGTNRSASNNHPTVKPTELMRYLVKLVTPPGGTTLDPFAGSGSTGRAADIEGFDAILVELDPEYAAIARRRISGDAPLLASVSEDAA